MSGVVRLATVPPPRPDICSTCWFSTRTTSRHLQCRRHAPKPSVEVNFCWPYVNDDDWCGEFRPAIVEIGA